MKRKERIINEGIWQRKGKEEWEMRMKERPRQREQENPGKGRQF